MDPHFKELIDRNASISKVYKPEFFRLTIEDDRKRFKELVSLGSILMHDELYDQLKELIKSRTPRRTLTAADHSILIDEHVKGCPLFDYGVWVYYPWSHRLVHMLDEDEFIELRTSANKNKITIAERDLLATKKVGVIGLSVGQSVSVTLALERGCGELRLADFDTLELNNLNRIRTGVHNLGILKAYIVAREIAEIDPFFKVVCYTEGITDENIHYFFLDGVKLYALIDECDVVNIKIICRIKARELRVPVLMEASDRGTLDVERFDLHPDMPIIHGWLEHLTLDLDVLKNLKSNDEKLPYILPISGLDTLSARMQASMIEIRNTLTTWPQLATAVTLGGALTADTCRRIFLNQFTDSGRYFVDLEQIIPDTRPKVTFAPEAPTEQITTAEMDALAGQALSLLNNATYAPSKVEIEEIVSAAIKAPSAGNSQPWLWLYKNGCLFQFYRNSGVVSFSDPDRTSSHLAHGAALEHIALKAMQLGITTLIELFPIKGNRALIAAISFNKDVDTDATNTGCDLAVYIDSRKTYRNAGNTAPLAPSVSDDLRNTVSSIDGAKLELITNDEELTALANIIGPMERLRLLNPESHYEFYEQQIRWNEGEYLKARDGVNFASLNISVPEQIGLKMVKNPNAASLLREWNGGQALEYTARNNMMNATAIGRITMPGSSPEDLIKGGIAMERLWLLATKHELAIQPIMTPMYFFANMSSEMPAQIKAELSDLKVAFEGILCHDNERKGVFLFKIGATGKPLPESTRKPIEDVLSIIY